MTHTPFWESFMLPEDAVLVDKPRKTISRSGAVVYVMRHPKFRAIKIGITSSVTTGRMNEHSSRGWRQERTFHFPSMKEARRVEQAVLHAFWRKGFLSPVNPLHMPQGGSTEVFRLRDVSVAQMVEEIESHMDGVIDA